MKHQAILFLFFLFFLIDLAIAQKVIHRDQPRVVTKEVKREFNEKELREMMKKDGIPDATINVLIEKRKLLHSGGRTVAYTNISKVNGNLPIPTASCGDMGAENGWAAWTAKEGDYVSGTVTWGAAMPPAAQRFNLPAPGVDPCTPGPPGAYPLGGPAVPTVAPGGIFGNTSIQLGQPETNGYSGGCNIGCSEQITYPLTVTPNDTNFIFTWAAFLDEPNQSTNPHGPAEQPYVSLCIYDQFGNVDTCGCFRYSSGNLTGFYQATCPSQSAGTVWYKPWTVVGVNLKNHLNSTITIVIENSDCAQGGHFAHSYWDFACPPINGSSAPYCVGQQTTITAPASDPANPYTYTWYQNGNLYTGAPNSTSQTITPIAQPGDTFAVQVHQTSGCDFWMPFVPQPMSTVATFTATGNCGQMNFTDQSTSSNSAYPISSWNWQFPGGSPASSVAQNPGTIQYSAGTYTATLTVSTSLGCPSTTTYTFTVGGFPTPYIIPTPVCLGIATTLTDGSLSAQNDPITSWSWSMPGGNPAIANSQHTSTTYNTPGTHTVTLTVVSQQGCPATTSQQVLVYNPPVADFGNPDSGCAPICVNYSDLSTSTDGIIDTWTWSFPGGTPSTSTNQHPQNICYTTPGSYGASIIIETNYGCKDTINLPMVEVYDWPTAEFCVTPSVAPTINPVFNFCDMWSSDVVQWSWNFGDNDSDIVNTDPIHSYSASATNNDFYSYNICIRVENIHGCWDEICHPVELIPEFEFYIPNTFTPNGDWINEQFYGKSRGVKEYNIWLFDRWGNQIWDCHVEDKNTNWDSDATIPRQEGLSSFCRWDGKVVKGGVDMGGGSRQLAQEDVYVWKVRLTDIFDKKHTYVGHVNIVR